MVIAVAGAVVLGALAFSFMRDQPGQTAPPVVTAATVTEAQVAPALPTLEPPATVSSPLLVAEADLYAVHEEQLHHLVAAHAEWFAVEYYSFDGSEGARSALAGLLPEGVPTPEAPSGTQVFVDWVRATSVSEAGPLLYQVEVIVRSLVSGPEGGFIRLPTRLSMVEVTLGSEGSPRVTRPPVSAGEAAPVPHQIGLGPLPDQVRDAVEAAHGTVVGGEALPDGGYRVVVMATDPDGVTRPRTVVVP